MLNSFLVATTALVPTLLAGHPAAKRHSTHSTVLGAVLSDSAPAHLGIALQLQNPAALKQLLADQQNVDSPRYHQWVTPEQFGESFGLPAADYAHVGNWLAEHGFAVQAYPNRLFLEATGTVGDVRRLLGVQLHWITVDGVKYRTYTGSVALPEEIAPRVVHIAGLDTRVRFHHHLTTNSGTEFGAQDLRDMYDLSPLINGTSGGASGLTTAVIGTQEQDGPPATGDISYYYQNVSSATAEYNPITLPNPNDDFDSQGANEEYELDVEMQSVGAPNATTINLVLSPASEVFSTGVNYAVNSLPTATVVSLSLGICEPGTESSETSAMETSVQQGLAEGQTWFAASGDSGADDCDQGSGSATVDFPADLPEIVAMGGTQMLDQNGPTWDSNGDLTSYQDEAAWNQGQNGGAGGGGISTLFTIPSYQSSDSTIAALVSGYRGVPDLALMAAPTPGVAADVDGTTGDLEPIGGTSVASPLAAGIFALISGQAGCRLGDIHGVLYQFGQAQAGGGTAVFHDITSGNNTFDGVTGFSAGPGYDLVTGWGSLDVAALAANWPCSGTVTGSSSGGSSGGTTSITTSSSSSSSSSSGFGGSSSSSSGGSSTSSSNPGSSGSSGASSSSGSGNPGSSGTGNGNGTSSSGGQAGGGTNNNGGGNGAGDNNNDSANNAPLVSNATPTPMTEGQGGGGCSTGAGASGMLAWAFLLSAAGARRRSRPARR